MTALSLTFDEFRDDVLKLMNDAAPEAECWLLGRDSLDEKLLIVLEGDVSMLLSPAVRQAKLRQAAFVMPVRVGDVDSRPGQQITGVLVDLSDGYRQETWIAERATSALLGAWQLLPPAPSGKLAGLLHRAVKAVVA